jgi:hypothetical protein
MPMNHNYEKSCPCQDCIRITFAARFGRPAEHEIISGKAEDRPIGNVSESHEVIGNPQSKRPRSSGYNG